MESSKQNYNRASRKQSQSELSKSALANHTVQYNHVIDWDNAKILGKGCNASIRRICESMWVRRRGPQAMDRDEGAHFVSHVFDPFLTGSTPSTAGVLPTGKRRIDQHHSEDGYHPGYLKLSICEFNFWFCFDELSFYK